VLKMARPGLLSALRDAFAQAKKEIGPVRKHSVAIGDNGSTRTCDVVVIPITAFAGAKELLYVVLFEDSVRSEKVSKGSAPKPARAAGLGDASKLQHELAATKEYLDSLIEEHGRTNEELGSANEELISSNEELQSMNEELETAKEELQSANEELITVNDELHSRNHELHQVNGDLVNLLDTVDLPVLISDVDRRIRRFTPKARSIMNVLPSDVGRPIDDIRPNVDVMDLDPADRGFDRDGLVERVRGAGPRGRFLPDADSARYRTTDNAIDGAMVSLVDIDLLKHNVRECGVGARLRRRIVEAVQVPLVVLDEHLRALSANEAFYLEFG